jgi:hypothetical protein
MLVTAGTVATSKLGRSTSPFLEADDGLPEADEELLQPAMPASARPTLPASMPRREIAFVDISAVSSMCRIMS